MACHGLVMGQALKDEERRITKGGTRRRQGRGARRVQAAERRAPAMVAIGKPGWSDTIPSCLDTPPLLTTPSSKRPSPDCSTNSTRLTRLWRTFGAGWARRASARGYQGCAVANDGSYLRQLAARWQPHKRGGGQHTASSKKRSEPEPRLEAISLGSPSTAGVQ